MTRLPSNPRFERWRWQIFGVTWLAYAGFYLTRKAFSVAKNELKKPEILGLTTGQNVAGSSPARRAILHQRLTNENEKIKKRAWTLLGHFLGRAFGFSRSPRP